MPDAQIVQNIYLQFVNQVKDYAIFATDNQGIITFWNEGAERLKGYTEPEIIGQFYGMLFPDNYQKEGKPQIEIDEARKNGSYVAEDWRKKKDGILFWARVTLTPIYSPEGEQIGFTKVTGDLTGHKELEDELARRNLAMFKKNEELKKTNIDLDNFIYTASHDLKAPIANIEGLIDLLKHDLSDKNWRDESTDKILQYIGSSIDRFKTTIRDLTEITKLQKNISQSTAVESIHIPTIYAEILADSGIQYTNKPCEIHTDFQVAEITYSRKNFRSVLYNMLSNAFRYQAPGRLCQIHVKTYQHDSFVILSVKDNGLGLKQNHKEQLFSMFKRFHNHVEGTGIGLYMIKRIVENAGGKIEVESEEGAGTEFRIYFKAD